MKNNIFLWENFGPMHADRCDAVAKTGINVIGLELYGKSDVYDWNPEKGLNFEKITLFKSGRPRGLALILALLKLRKNLGKSNWFLCHYEWKEIFVFASLLRLLGDNVFTMGCSKFDDFSRNSKRELLKSFFFKPYQGAIGSGIRSKSYFEFHGIPSTMVVTEYNTVSTQRIRELAHFSQCKIYDNYENRYFTIVARLVPKKNLFMALDAYKIYLNTNTNSRLLKICGSGPLEADLKAYAQRLDIEKYVVFMGFIQTAEISKTLSKSLALVLPSIEEQFGNVVIEAQALGLPVLLSEVCGAKDKLVRSAINGFIFEPDNPEGLAWFMTVLSNDQELWKKMSSAALKYSEKGDVKTFASAVQCLLQVQS